MTVTIPPLALSQLQKFTISYDPVPGLVGGSAPPMTATGA